MLSKQLLLLFVTSMLLITPGRVFSQPIIDDQFDDGDPATNTTGNGDGFNLSFPGAPTEADGILSLFLDNSASQGGMLSKNTFTANSSDTIYGTFSFTEMTRPSTANGTSRWYTGFFDNNGDDDDDNFQQFGNISGSPADGGLWVAFKEREDQIAHGPLNGDEGSLYYILNDQEVVLLERWTWDRSVFAYDEDAIAAGRRTDQIGQDLLVDLQVELSANSTGYGLRFSSSDDNAILPADIAGTWAAAGVTDLSSLDNVHAVPFGGQNGQMTLIELDRVYVDHAPQRDADDSGQVFTWGPRIADGSWGNTSGWQKGGIDTADIPLVVTSTRQADAVQVLNGTVHVDTGDQGAWTVQVNNGATLDIASTRTLEIIENVSDSAVSIQAGGNLVIGGMLITPSIGGAGTVTFADGTLRLDHGSIGAVATTSDGTISNAREVSVGQVTLGVGDALIKQRIGTLILDQSGGANSLAATSAIDIQSGAVAGVNDAANNALGSAAINLNGGNLTLSASTANSVAFDTPVEVNASGSITAEQVTGSTADESVTLGGNNGVMIADGAVATLRTSDGYLMNVAGAVSGAGTLSVGDGASVNLTGNIAPAALEFRGDTSNVTVGASAIPSQTYQFSPTANTRAMVFNSKVTSAAEVIIDEDDDVFNGSVQLNNSSNDYTGTTRVVSGALIPDVALPGDYNGDGMVNGGDHDEWKTSFGNSVTPRSGADGNGDGVVNAADYVVWRKHNGMPGASGLPAASLLQFEGSSVNNVAVLQTSQDFARDIGAGAGEVNWAGSGGFAAAGGGTVNVTLEGGSTLIWDSPTAGFNGQSLKLGSPSADGRVVITNNIDLNNAPRTVELRDNQGSGTDVAELSGVISSSAGGADVLRVEGQTNEFESGLLNLTGANTYTTLELAGGTTQADDGIGLPSSASLAFNSVGQDTPAIFATNGTFTRNVGTGAGEVNWVGSGGFAAAGGDLTVTLEGGATLVGDSQDSGFNNNHLQLGSPVADGVTTFTNDTDGAGGGGNSRTIETFDNPLTDGDRVVITGDHTNYGTFRIDGNGSVELTGNIVTDDMFYLSNAGPGQLSVQFNGTGTVNDEFRNEINNLVGVFINGSISVDNTFRARGGSFNGGTGTVFMVDTDDDGQGSQQARAENGGFFVPGADFDSVGTLTFDLSLSGGVDTVAGSVDIQNGGGIEIEFENDGGVQNDLINVVSNSGFGLIQLGTAVDDTWNLELDALNDLTGLISGTNEFDLLTWNANIDFAINGTVINVSGNETGTVDNVILSSTDFDINGATVEYEVAGDLSGRVFVTGLGLLSGAGAAVGSPVPEPASCLLAVLATVVVLAGRRRGNPEI